jgi:thiamine biosynthesis lipoprotein
MIARLVITGLLGVATATVAGGAPPLDRFEFSQTEMAVPMELVLYAPDKVSATKASEAVFARLHQLNSIMSDYDAETELSKLSSTSGSGKAIPVSEDLWAVLTQAKAVSEKSDGAFDVTIGPVVRLWRRARRQHELPRPDQIQKAMQSVGYRAMRLVPEQRAVELLKPGMRLDLGGIGKGYAVGQAMAVLRSHGIASAMFVAGGDMAVSDPPPGRHGWRIGIAPLEPKQPPSQFLWLSRCAVSTSGDLWQFVEIGTRRYSHIVDPRTGQALTDHCSVTLIMADNTLADAMAKVVAVLGVEKGLPMIDALPGAAAWVVRAPEGKTLSYQSSRWKELPQAK